MSKPIKGRKYQDKRKVKGKKASTYSIDVFAYKAQSLVIITAILGSSAILLTKQSEHTKVENLC